MRAFQQILILLNTWYLVKARLPYIKSSGYYSPFPPSENPRVIYEFSPLQEAKSRETRDLAWRQFDAFLNGNEEPSCADLRRMWRLARKLQEEAVETNELPQEMHPFKAASYSTLDKSSPEEPTQLSQSSKELQRKKFSDEAAKDQEEEEEVYGIVKTHAPPQAPQVRDPTKEILSGLYGHKSQNLQQYFGRIRTHHHQEQKPVSHLQMLKNKLYGTESENSKSEPVFGTVQHRFKPKESKLDLVRSILAKEEGVEVNVESKNAFDRIRDRLLNTRVRSSRERSLRRRGSKKRRRNKKRRKNRQKNRRKNRKWRISRDKIREQNLLLKKLGK